MTKSGFLEYLGELVDQSKLEAGLKEKVKASLTLEGFTLMEAEVARALNQVVQDFIDEHEDLLLSQGSPEEIEDWTEIKNAFMESQFKAEETYLKSTGVDMAAADATIQESPASESKGKDILSLYAGLSD